MRTFRVVVDTTKPRQTIAHFGASGCWSLDPIGSAWEEKNKERLAELLFSRTRGIGLSLFRFNLGAGSDKTDRRTVWHPWRAVSCFRASATAPYDWTQQAGQQWFLRAAKRHGVEKTLAFVNSPPVWLTKNGHAFCDDDSGSCNLKDGAEAAFGRFLADVMAHFRSIGLAFDYLSPINEPNWDWKGGQEGCRYAHADIRRVLKAVHRELRRAGLETELDACDSGDIRLLLDDAVFRDYARVRSERGVAKMGMEAAGVGKYREGIRELLGDPEIRRILGGKISAHSYWTYGSAHDLLELRRLLRQNLDRYVPGGKYWMTEVCIMESGRDLGMDTALRVARIIHADLVQAEASAWHWWLAVSPGKYKDGLIYTDYDHSGGPQNILPAKTLWTLGNWSRYLRPGSRRLSLQTDALPDDLLASSFLTHDGKQLVVVLVNDTSEEKRVTLAVNAATGAWTASVTDARSSLKPQAVKGKLYIAPPRSVSTLIAAKVGGAGGRPPAVAPIKRERPGRDSLYQVRCGGPETPLGPDAGGRYNSRADQPLGPDPGTGHIWGWEAWGESGAREGVRWEEGDTVGRGLTYRFTVPTETKVNIELTFVDPWKNPGRALDILLNGETRETGLVPGGGTLTRTYSGVLPRQGKLTVSVVRSHPASAPDQDPLISRIRVWR